jgi:membrane protease YdiL (CAAX protease family)
MNKAQKKSEKSEFQSEYTLWREVKNVWVTKNKTFISGAQRNGNEYSAYSGAASFLGTLVLACAVIHFIFTPIIPLILDALPLDFGFDLWNSTYYGDTKVVFILDTLQKSAGFILIIIAGLWGGKLPVRVLFTKKIRSKAAFAASIGAALSLGAIYIIMVKLTGGVLLPTALDIPLLPQILLSLFVIPVLCEIAYRGVLLFIFRQYGDFAAIITVSIAASLLQFDFRLIPGAIIVSAVLCYFSLAAENIIVPALMHLIMNGVIVLYSIFNTRSPDSSAVLLLFAVCFAAGVIACIYLLKKHPEDVETEWVKDPLRSSDKLFCMFTSVPVICAIAAIVVTGHF